MTAQDRKYISELVGGLLEDSDSLVVTHTAAGVLETARFLSLEIKNISRAIVFTPDDGETKGDCSKRLQNLLAALLLGQHLEPGIYIISDHRAIPYLEFRGQ